MLFSLVPTLLVLRVPTVINIKFSLLIGLFLSQCYFFRTFIYILFCTVFDNFNITHILGGFLIYAFTSDNETRKNVEVFSSVHFLLILHVETLVSSCSVVSFMNNV